jgi:hypothetical protein
MRAFPAPAHTKKERAFSSTLSTGLVPPDATDADVGDASSSISSTESVRPSTVSGEALTDSNRRPNWRSSGSGSDGLHEGM